MAPSGCSGTRILHGVGTSNPTTGWHPDEPVLDSARRWLEWARAYVNSVLPALDLSDQSLCHGGVLDEIVVGSQDLARCVGVLVRDATQAYRGPLGQRRGGGGVLQDPSTQRNYSGRVTPPFRPPVERCPRQATDVFVAHGLFQDRTECLWPAAADEFTQLRGTGARAPAPGGCDSCSSGPMADGPGTSPAPAMPALPPFPTARPSLNPRCGSPPPLAPGSCCRGSCREAAGVVRGPVVNHVPVLSRLLCRSLCCRPAGV